MKTKTDVENRGKSRSWFARFIIGLFFSMGGWDMAMVAVSYTEGYGHEPFLMLTGVVSLAMGWILSR
jgi:general stress protein CsbA